MRRQRRGLIIGISIMFMMVLCMSIGATSNQGAKGNTGDKNIVDFLKKNEKEYGTLAQALEAAGLTDTLKGEGPFTVFVPTNRAFEQLPKGALDNLLKSSNKAQLTDILTYHVTKGKLPAEELLKLNDQELNMLNGKNAKIEVKNGSVYINGAKVLKADIPVSNGVIHVIDTVLMPEK